MISTAIKGTDTASGIDLTQLSSAGKSGGASFQKIMSKSLSSNVNNKASQNMVQTKTASGMKSTSTQQNTKQVSAQDDTAASTAKKTSDNTQSTLSDNSDKLTDAGEKIKDFLKEKLGVTDEEFEKAMADLGRCMQDLLQPANLTDLVVELTGVEDAVAIITNAVVPCNGRFPFLISIATIFIAGAYSAGNGFLSSILSTLAVIIVIIFGIFLTLIISKILSKTILKGMPSSFVLELPPYRKPQIS